MWLRVRFPLHSFNLVWSTTCVITNSTGVRTFAIIDTKRSVQVVTLSTEDNVKLLLQPLKLDFKRTIKWKKCLSKNQ